MCILALPLWTAGILVAIGDTRDYLDGGVARKQSTESREGAMLDAVLDRYSDVAVIGALVYLTADSFLQVGLAALVGAMLTPYVKAEAEGKPPVPTIGSRGMRDRVLVIGLLLGQPVWTLATIAIISNLSAIHRLVIAVRKERK